MDGQVDALINWLIDRWLIVDAWMDGYVDPLTDLIDWWTDGLISLFIYLLIDR